MTQDEMGKLIAELRKSAGYTQKSLAEALGITDKAVSKWERGICSPDCSVLPKLAGLIDTDLGTLVPDYFSTKEWKGLLVVDDAATSVESRINGKPLIHYLLSYFMLLEIKDIEIQTQNKEAVLELKLEEYGLNIHFDKQPQKRTMVVYGKTLLFGAYLTKQLQNIMAAEENIALMIDGLPVPIMFIHEDFDEYQNVKDIKYRSLYRGTVCLPLDSDDDIQNADIFIRIYEKSHHLHFCDLSEIAESRGLL